MFTMHLGMSPWLSHDIETSHTRLSHHVPETKSLWRIANDSLKSYSSHSPPVILLYAYEAASNITFFAGFQRVSRSWMLVATSEHVIINVIICNLDETAHDRRILLYIGRTFFKFHCMNVLMSVNSTRTYYSLLIRQHVTKAVVRRLYVLFTAVLHTWTALFLDIKGVL